MELRKLQTNELVALSRDRLEEFYYVRSGRIQMKDDKNNVIAQYGPKMIVGLSEYLSNNKLVGDLSAYGNTRVAVVTRDELDKDFAQADQSIKRLLKGILKTLARRHVGAGGVRV